MTTPLLSRRNIFAAAAAAAAAGTFLGSLDAALGAAPSADEGPGFHRFKLGSYELTAIHDGVWHRPIDATFVRGTPWADVQQAMADAHMPQPGKLSIPFTPLVVNTGSK